MNWQMAIGLFVAVTVVYLFTRPGNQGVEIINRIGKAQFDLFRTLTGQYKGGG